MSNELPKGYQITSLRHIVGEDCMGQPEDYWKCEVIAPDKDSIMGVGSTSKEAIDKVTASAIEHNAFNNLNDLGKYLYIMGQAKQRRRIYDRELLILIEFFGRRIFDIKETGI